MKSFLKGFSFSAVLSVLMFVLCAIINGCTTTQTTSNLINDNIINILTDQINKLDKEQVKKLETAIKEKLKDEDTKAKDNLGGTGTGDNKTEETKQETENKDQNSSSVDKIKIIDAFPLSDLTFNISVDTPQLANHYTGFQNQTHPWALMKDLPVTVTIKKFDASGIDLEGVPQGNYTQSGWERTSTFWAFDENGVELGYEDNAYTSYPEPGKFYGKCKYILVVRCSDIQAIARSRVMEVK